AKLRGVMLWDVDSFGDAESHPSWPSLQGSDHESVSREGQAQWLAAAYRIADDLPSIAGLGWLNLTDEAGLAGRSSSNYGLLTTAGARKPAYEAFRLTPAVRFRPDVRAAPRIRRRTLSGRGLRVKVRTKLDGEITVELRTRRGRRLARVARPARAGKLRTLRLRRRDCAAGATR
ncbi:MAG: hypothetical protein WKF94_08835, partial [Solirubrobacteraceae bacterium]